MVESCGWQLAHKAIVLGFLSGQELTQGGGGGYCLGMIVCETIGMGSNYPGVLSRGLLARR